MFKEQQNFLIIGKKGSGKTALGWKIAEKINQVSKRDVYFFNFPNLEMLDKIPFEVTNVLRINELRKIMNGVILIDEAHRFFDCGNKKINDNLRDILSISRQNNNCFIFVAHNSYFVNKSLFSFIDVKLIKEVVDSHWDLERPHMKKLYQDLYVKGVDKYFIDSDEIKEECRFDKPEWYTDEMSNAYSSKKVVRDIFTQVLSSPVNNNNNNNLLTINNSNPTRDL